MIETKDARLRKLQFRAWRRGFREADLILGPFADFHVQTMTPSELDAFETLLDQPDPDLYGWILGQTETPAKYDTEVMSAIKMFREQAHENITHGG